MAGELTTKCRRARLAKNSTQLCVLMVLADYANTETGEVYPSVERVADDCNCSVRTVQVCIRELQDVGVLIFVGKPNRSRRTNTYRLNVAMLDTAIATKQGGDAAGSNPADPAPYPADPAPYPADPAPLPRRSCTLTPQILHPYPADPAPLSENYQRDISKSSAASGDGEFFDPSGNIEKVERAVSIVGRYSQRLKAVLGQKIEAWEGLGANFDRDILPTIERVCNRYYSRDPDREPPKPQYFEQEVTAAIDASKANAVTSKPKPKFSEIELRRFRHIKRYIDDDYWRENCGLPPDRVEIERVKKLISDGVI